MALIRHFINGEEFGQAQRTGPVYNPATGAHQHDVIHASSADVEAAIASARAAFPAWRAEPDQALPHPVPAAATPRRA